MILILLCLMLSRADQRATAQATPAPMQVTVRGVVNMGTAGDVFPTGLALTLHRVVGNVAEANNISTQQGAVNADRSYTFADVTVTPGTVIFVTTTYAGITQGSPLIEVEAAKPIIDLPVTLYAQGNDADAITLVRVQNIIETVPGNLLRVLATYYFSNNTDRFYFSSEKTADGAPFSVGIPLPVGAGAIAMSTPKLISGGTTVLPIVQDLRPILPGQLHELVFSYQIPYAKGAPIDQDYPYATQRVEVLIPDDLKITLDGDFEASANTALNPARPYTEYRSRQPIAANGRLIYTLTGGTFSPTPQPTPPRPAPESVGSNLPAIFLLVGVISLMILAGVSMVVGGRRPTPP